MLVAMKAHLPGACSGRKSRLVRWLTGPANRGRLPAEHNVVFPSDVTLSPSGPESAHAIFTYYVKRPQKIGSTGPEMQEGDANRRCA